MLSFAECVALRPCNMVYIGTEDDFVHDSECIAGIEDIHDIQIELVDGAGGAGDALELVYGTQFEADVKLVVFGLWRYMRRHQLSTAAIMAHLSLFCAVPNIAFGDAEETVPIIEASLRRAAINTS